MFKRNPSKHISRNCFYSPEKITNICKCRPGISWRHSNCKKWLMPGYLSHPLSACGNNIFYMDVAGMRRHANATWACDKKKNVTERYGRIANVNGMLTNRCIGNWRMHEKSVALLGWILHTHTAAQKPHMHTQFIRDNSYGF